MVAVKNSLLQIFSGIILLIAFLAQSIMPSGFMPSFEIGKTFQIIICQGVNQVSIEVDKDMNPVQKSGHIPKNTPDHLLPCLYASFTPQYFHTHEFLLSEIIYLTYEEFVIRDIDLIHSSPPTPHYHAQAPPNFLG